MMDHEEWRKAYLRATGDDIVVRLREYWLKHNAHPIAEEAANTIEQLRTELIELTSEVQRLQSISRY